MWSSCIQLTIPVMRASFFIITLFPFQISWHLWLYSSFITKKKVSNVHAPLNLGGSLLILKIIQQVRMGR